MVADLREIANMVARPHHHVVADLYVERYRLIVENEAILAQTQVLGSVEMRIRVADEGIPLPFRRKILPGAQRIHLLIAEEDEHLILTGREALLHVLERDDRQIVKSVFRDVLAVDHKGAYLVVAVAPQEPVRNISAATGTEEDDLAHFDGFVFGSPMSSAACLRTRRSSHSCTLTPARAAALRASSFASGVTPSITPK